MHVKITFLYGKGHYHYLYNALNTTRAVIGRCPWSITVQTHGWRHGKNCFLCFVQHMARSFENVCEINSNWASEGLEKSLAEAVYKHEKEETKAKVFLSIWKCLNWNKSSKQLLVLRKGSQFWKYLLDYSALSKRRPRKKIRGSCLRVR